MPQLSLRYQTVVFSLIVLSMMMGLATEDLRAQARSRRQHSATVNKAPQKKKGARAGSRKTRRPRIRTTPMTALSALRERELSPGVRYIEYRSNGSVPIDVHVVRMDRTVSSNAIRIIKGEDRHDGLERIKDMSLRYGNESTNSLLAVVNANFWRAYRSTPIGPCVVDGEIVEMLPYKRWSSAFFDVDNHMIIDTFRIFGSMRFQGSLYSIGSVNRRVDSSSICMYNAYAGDAIPFVNAKDLERGFQEAIKDTIFTSGDSTEDALSREQLRIEIARAQREANTEYPLLKIRLRYLRSPSINEPIACEVLGTDTGTVRMPLRGCVVSIPAGVLPRVPKQGDTVTLQFQTNVRSRTRFMNAVSGTPRLVRSGTAKHEADIEGSTGRRFIQQNLARTAIGVDRSGNKIIVAAIRASDGSTGTMGATLKQTADVMRLLGAYHAINLDGGGSTGMVVEDDHVFFEGEDPLTRRIAVGLAIVKRSHVWRRTTSSEAGR